VERGILEGRRLLVSDRPLSYTGAHGDKRRMSETQDAEIFCPTAGMRSVVCDGVDEARRAAREQLRLGADQIKVMASGGSSPLVGSLIGLDKRNTSGEPSLRRCIDCI
jgi:imidazolonepropionase-like amidohydrolase